MSQLKRNTIANLIGRFWDKIIVLLCVPFYLKFLGVEAYGLVGFYVTLLGVFSIFGMGFGVTLNREMARLSAVSNNGEEQADLLRTLETVFWSASFLAGLLIVALAPLISRHWLNPEHLSINTVKTGVRLMGLSMALQFPFGLYQGGLRGLQRQVLLNGVIIAMGTLRGLGAVMVLWLVSPTIEAFFLWQIFVNALGAAAVAVLLWQALPGSTRRPRFKKTVLQEIWGFTMTISASSILGMFLVQIDKVLLSKFLTLESFGYYILASVVANSLFSIDYPINQAAFPQFVLLAEQKDESGLRVLYHRVSQFISVALLPVAMVIVLFSPEIMLAWTLNPMTMEKTYLLVSLLTTGIMFCALSDLPINLQVATGWPQLSLYTKLGLAMVLVPGMIVMASHYGAPGAALLLALLNSAYLLVNVPIMHRYLLKGEKWRWYKEDVGQPFVGALVICALGRWLIPGQLAWVENLIFLAIIWGLATTASALLAPQVRTTLINYFCRYQKVFTGQ